MPSLQRAGQRSLWNVVRRAPSEAASRARWMWWRELALIAVLYLAYNAVQASVGGQAPQATHDGQLILHAERALHINVELSLNHGIDRMSVLAVIACYMYASLHFLLTPAVLVWTCVRRPASYSSARAVLLIMTVVALLGFWLFPTAPPRFLQVIDDDADDGNRAPIHVERGPAVVPLRSAPLPAPDPAAKMSVHDGTHLRRGRLQPNHNDDGTVAAPNRRADHMY